MKNLISVFVFWGMFLFPLIGPGYSQVEEKQIDATQQEAESQLDIVLVLDNSGSMKKKRSKVFDPGGGYEFCKRPW